MRSKSKGWIKLAFVVMNIGALIFLGLCHQRAPLDVNRRIVKLVQQQYASLPSRGSIVTVHYLMGCHSTPLYSHLHVPSVRVVAKTLDCSPDCRSNKTCESDAFERDPKHFVEDLYFSSLKGPMCLGGIDQVCNDQDDNPVLSETPDFVVVSSQNAVGLRPQLATMGLMEIDRFFHSIHDLTVGAFGKQRESSVDQEYRRLPIFNMASLSFEEIVLFHTQREHDQRAL
jgi:phosphatidylinositol glycan class B